MARWILGGAITMTGFIFEVVISVFGDTIRSYLTSYGITDQAAVTYLLSAIVVIWIGTGIIIIGSSVLKRFGYQVILFKITRTTSSIDPRFAHLTIHYSQRTDNPATAYPARPRYVTDNRKMQAYWVSDYLEPAIKEHRIQWHSHDGEKALKSKLKDYRFNERDPLPDEVDISVNQPSSPNPRMRGIEIYRDDTELKTLLPLQVLFSKAETRINILAMDAGISVKAGREALREALKRSIEVRYLLLDEDAKDLLTEVGKAWALGGDANETLQESLLGLRTIKKEVPSGRLTVRLFKYLPIHSMIIIDPESAHALIQVTTYRYDTHSWVSLVFSEKDQPELFKAYLKSYKFVDDDTKTRFYPLTEERKSPTKES